MTRFFKGVCAFAVVAATLAWSSPAATAADDVTLFVVPARYSVLQAMFDVLRRYPSGLVSYQGDAQTVRPVLHAWDGSEWQPVSMDDFKTGKFATVKPTRVVLVGEASQLPPVLAEDASSWCPVVMNLTELDSASLLNSCGKILGFTGSDWKWFAARYNMDMKDANAGRRKDSWYYHPYVERGAIKPRTTLSPAEVAPPAAEAPAVEPVKPAPAVEVKPAAEPAPAFAPNAMWEKPEKDPAPAKSEKGIK